MKGGYWGFLKRVSLNEFPEKSTPPSDRTVVPGQLLRSKPRICKINVNF